MNALPSPEAPAVDPSQSVAGIVLDHPECAAVFHRRRIDFCCGGRDSLAATCEAQHIPLAPLLEELGRAIVQRTGPRRDDPRAWSTPDLIRHIVVTHHAYLREALPFVQGLSIKVARVHGDHNPRLEDLCASVIELAETLIAHLDAEERSLFPALSVPAPDKARLGQDLLAMRDEHATVGDLLTEIRFSSEDYKIPDWACTSYRTLFKELEAIEDDLMRHVHLENHVLLPRFLS